MTNPDRLFQEALAALRAGDAANAELGFRKFLKVQPRHVGALNLLTVALMSMERFKDAEPVIAKAIELNKGSDTSFYNYGLVLKKVGKPEIALQQFDQAIRLNANVADTWNNRGTVRNDLGQYDLAIPDFDKALALNPNYAEAWHNKARSLIELKRFDEALPLVEKAMKLKPGLTEAWLAYARVLAALNRLGEALAASDSAIAQKPDMAMAQRVRGDVLHELQRYDDALAAYEKALKLDPGLAEAWIGQGNVYRALKRHEEALTALGRALESAPGSGEAWLRRGYVLDDLKRFDEGLAALREALNRRPGFANAYLAQANIHLSRGEFHDGWDLYEWRSQCTDDRASLRELMALDYRVRVPRDELIGKDVLVLAEQGVGDEVMFASMLPDLLRDARSVVFQADKRLVRLFAHSFPTAAIVSRSEPVAEHRDGRLVIQEGSLGYAYRRDRAAFPQRPYLRAEPDRVARWKERLAADAGARPRIGISWRGGTSKTRRNDRSFELEKLAPVLASGAHVVSLQYGDVTDEISAFNRAHAGQAVHTPLNDFNDFDEFAALISALDLIVSVQNVTVHMSGAVGTPCWGMVPWRAEWRYGNEDTRIAWYPSVLLYRQHVPDDWDSVIGRIVADLTAFCRSRSVE